MSEDRDALAADMVRHQLRRRGITDERVLQAMSDVPRDEFVEHPLVEYAYDDTPLPIGEQQTISQPYVVALMLEMLELTEDSRMLEVGAGSGYAAAVAGQLAGEVYSIERYQSLAAGAAERCARLGYENVHIIHADGMKGLPEHAPFGAILVSAVGAEVPPALREQLAVGGRMVIPVGEFRAPQKLLLVERTSDTDFKEHSLGAVQFVPLLEGVVAERTYDEDEGTEPVRAAKGSTRRRRASGNTEPAKASGARPRTGAAGAATLIGESSEALRGIDEADLAPLLDRIGSARVVLLGEATHGTSEFYRMRARITEELLLRRGFSIIAVEADWPDAAKVDRYLKNLPPIHPDTKAFRRFPSWMWGNTEIVELVEWLRSFHAETKGRVGFYGLDLYSLYHSIDAVVGYLERVDPAAAQAARVRYGCLSPWEQDPLVYGKAAHFGRAGCEEEVVEMLRAVLENELRYTAEDGSSFLDAVGNARLVASAERYYREMYRSSTASWNLRDTHMADTLEQLLRHHGPDSKAIVWAHNSHLGDARATEMAARGEVNLGQLCRERFGEEVYAIGFGTHGGTVAAASSWGGEVEIKNVRPSRPGSIEHLCHESGREAFLLPLKIPKRDELPQELSDSLLQRAIGVIYRPETELASHYFHAVLPRQFDEYIWFDETTAVTPLSKASSFVSGAPDTYPFGV